MLSTFFKKSINVYKTGFCSAPQTETFYNDDSSRYLLNCSVLSMNTRLCLKTFCRLQPTVDMGEQQSFTHVGGPVSILMQHSEAEVNKRPATATLKLLNAIKTH